MHVLMYIFEFEHHNRRNEQEIEHVPQQSSFSNSIATHFSLPSFQLHTTVKSCEPAILQMVVNGKKEKLNGFNVILDDTVLFPEGGGQVSPKKTA